MFDWWISNKSVAEYEAEKSANKPILEEEQEDAAN
jgi:hypothetical protein